MPFHPQGPRAMMPVSGLVDWVVEPPYIALREGQYVIRCGQQICSTLSATPDGVCVSREYYRYSSECGSQQEKLGASIWRETRAVKGTATSPDPETFQNNEQTRNTNLYF